MTDRQPLQQTEAEFQKAVIEYAQMRGWRVAHFRPARTEKGWRTAVTGDGVGFPDLVLVRRRVIFAELKSDTGCVSVAQADWINALHDAGQEAYVWRPKDWDQIERTLTP